MQRSTRTVSFMLGAAAAGLISSGFAHVAYAAQFGPGAAKTEVSYADLDLSRSEQANVLYRRIERAARQVCHVTTITKARVLPVQRECMEKAMDDAVREVDNANLTAVYLARSGKHSMVASSR